MRAQRQTNMIIINLVVPVFIKECSVGVEETSIRLNCPIWPHGELMPAVDGRRSGVYQCVKLHDSIVRKANGQVIFPSDDAIA